jgi:hypothetical protein
VPLTVMSDAFASESCTNSVPSLMATSLVQPLLLVSVHVEELLFARSVKPRYWPVASCETN